MRSSRDASAHQLLLPRQGGGSPAAAALPLLPLFDAVLLPGGFARVTIPASWRASAALVELLLQQQGEADVLVAAVPFLTGKPTGGSSGAAGGGAGSDDEGLADDPLDLDKLHHTGTAARVLQLARRTQSSGWSVLLEGRCRVRVRGVHLSSRPRELYEASVEQLDYLPPSPGKGTGPSSGGSASGSGSGGSKQQEELAQELLKGTRRLFVLIQGEAEGRAAAARVARALSQQGPARMTDVLGSLVARTLRDRLALLSTLGVTARQQMVLSLLNQMLEVAEKAAAGRSGGGSQRGARTGGSGGGLRLPDFGGAGSGEEDDEEEGKQELLALMQKLKDANPPAEVLRAAQREFKRLQRGSEHHPGYAMSLSYLETLADLPWSRLSQLAQQQLPPGTGGASSEPGPGGSSSALSLLAPGGGGGGAAPLPLGLVRQRLDEAHYGLDKIKERIVQFVAVQRLRGWDARAPILCFIGPPGVGKTSLARSIADVLGRPFQRISLGGVRDEAEIRGHRRTYIGAMPGRVIQAMRKAGVRDPLLLLDEVDKMGRDARGDPAAALLEVLDPEQNAGFVDTYLGLPFDLSSALFVATANRASDIPPPLLDRLEVVQLGGYTLEEKVHIAERHLIPRLLAEHGLRREQLVFPAGTAGAVRSIIEGYTSEAGVRSLSRCLAAICRHVAVQVVQQREEEGSSAPLLGGLLGASSGGGGSGEQPDLPPGLEEAAARAAAAQGEAANSGATPPLAALHSVQAMHSRGGGMLVQPPSAGRDDSAMQLWAQLLPLAGSPAAAAATATATGGYPWRQLAPPMRGNAAAAEAAGAATQCTCPSRKQPRWFSWLRWARHDGAAEQAQQEVNGDGSGEAAHPCSCAGRCGEPDCCCHSHASRGQLADGAAGHEAWGPPGEAGMAADSSSWEASWRQSALAREPPLLCGPGSMQVLRPPLAEALAAAGAGSLSTAPRLAVGVAAAAAAARAAAGRQPGAGLALPLDGLPEAGGAGEQGWPSVSRQQQQQQAIVVDEALIEVVLGPRRFEGHNSAERVASPGTAAGLVWTSVGGKLQYIECICVGAGRGGAPGQLTLTGQLGDVLEESARIALSWVRAHAAALGLPGDASCPSRRWDVHIHLPAGAVPKDGPSAGITLAVALVSLFTGKCVRADTAMTGELTLRGLVLPVGGIKEKLLAAQAAGMARVLVPARNKPDVQADVPAEVRQGLEVVACSRLEDVLAAAFDPPISLAPQPLLARL